MLNINTYKEKFHFSVNFYSAFLLVTFIPDFIGMDPGIIRNGYWALKVLLACWVIYRSKKSYFHFNATETLFLIVFLIYAANIFVDVFYAPLYKFKGMGGTIDFIGFILILILSLSFRFDPAYHSEKSFKFFMISLSIGLIIAYFHAAVNTVQTQGSSDVRFDANSTVNTIVYGQTGCALALVSIYGIVTYQKKLLRLLFAVAFVIGMLSIAKAGSRSPIVVMAMVTTFFFMAKLGKLKGIIIICLFAALVFVFIGPIIELFNSMGSTLIARLTNAVETGESSGRDLIWKNVLNLTSQSPIFGVYYVIPSGNGAGFYPHNFFLEVFMATGFVGGIPFIILVFVSLSRSFTLIKMKHPATWIVVLYLQLIGYGMFSTGLYSSQDFWVLIFYIMSINLNVKKISPKSSTLVSAKRSHLILQNNE